MKRCPNCGSKEIESYLYSEVLVLKCNSCSYDEGVEFGQDTTQKTNQKAKSSYSPYKTGGSKRTIK